MLVPNNIESLEYKQPIKEQALEKVTINMLVGAERIQLLMYEVADT